MGRHRIHWGTQRMASSSQNRPKKAGGPRSSGIYQSIREQGDMLQGQNREERVEYLPTGRIVDGLKFPREPVFVGRERSNDSAKRDGHRETGSSQGIVQQ